MMDTFIFKITLFPLKRRLKKVLVLILWYDKKKRGHGNEKKKTIEK
ncbi:hypothetical protein RU93_GL001860 [Enterococcus aquimarinus]|uniref:Uncharacterized protein n=1 Tax=Enterococcus aquimarinus TaxID=328396 RepID=A0A1L8QU12_9ENTE|nr:hypothetical protein RU93_GL001860 [Enterococcus aquimarinus]